MEGEWRVGSEREREGGGRQGEAMGDYEGRARGEEGRGGEEQSHGEECLRGGAKFRASRSTLWRLTDGRPLPFDIEMKAT